MNDEPFDSEQRRKEKELSRKQDQEDLANGVKTREELRIENGVFAQLKAKPDFEEWFERQEKIKQANRDINQKLKEAKDFRRKQWKEKHNK